MYLLAIFILALFIALLVLSDKLTRLTRRISQLEFDLKEIRKDQVRTSHGPVEASPRVADSRPLPIPGQVSGRTPVPPPPGRPIIPPKPKAPSRSQQEWEQLIGGKLLNRIGALALIIGVGFFMKYAFDNNWISESARIMIGILFGAAMIWFGARTHKKGFQIFSQGIFGSGIAILYLSIYASFNFYHLVPQSAAFAAMSAVTVTALVLASRYDALAIAFLGWGGGFLTPFLLSTGQANAPGLFSYLVLLNIGVLTVLARKRTWDILAPLSLAATAIIFASWSDKFFRPEDFWTALGFIVIVWAAYVVYHVYCQAKKIPNSAARYVASILNAVGCFFGLFSILDSRSWLALSAAIEGAAYLGIYVATYRQLAGEKATEIIYLLSAIVLASAAILVGYDGFDRITYWSLEAFILIWCGLFWNRRIVWQAALGVLAVAGFGLLKITRAFIYEPINTFTLLANERALAFAALAVALGGGAYLLKRFKADQADLPHSILQAACAITLFALFTAETLDYFRHLMAAQGSGDSMVGLTMYRNMTLPSLWIIYSLPLIWYGLKRRSTTVTIVSICVSVIAFFVLVLAGRTYAPVENFSIFFNVRAVAVIIMLGAIFIQGRLLSAHKTTFPWVGVILDASRIAAALLGLFLLTVEAWDLYDKSIALIVRTSVAANVNFDQLKNLQQLSLSGIWLLYSVAMMALGLWRRQRAVRMLSIGLFGISVLKIFTYDLSFLQTLYRIFSFIGLGVILLAVSYAYQRYKSIIFGGSSKPPEPETAQKS